jgi:C4-dicarboxylate-specific signal transduction histidine kinase
MTERESMVEELDVLNHHLQHIRQLVSSQQSYAKGAVMYEMASVENLITDAMNITYATVARHNVTVEREIPALPRLMLDRHKILQILVNLLSNAAQACAASGKPDRRIQISVYQPQVESIVFQVADNGIGIPPENRIRIFSHGFTTRSDGHGFGLHSCANAAREMGGSLNALSDGAGTGATFVLSLPVSSKKPGG